MNKILKCCLSVLLVISLSIPSNILFATKKAYAAESGTSVSSYEISYGVDSAWDGAFNAHINIKNVSSSTIEDWRLQFTMEQEITNIWNAVIENHNDSVYKIKNSGWNQDINPGETVSIGFTASGKSTGFPKDFSIISEEQIVKEGYSTSFVVNSDWGDGFSGELVITNTGEVAIEDWTIEFDFDRTIDNLWNGVVIGQNGSRYIVKNSGYNQMIMPGQTVRVGFNGHVGMLRGCEPTNIIVRSFGVEPNAYMSDGRVKIDTSELIFDENDIYFVPQSVYSIYGIAENADDIRRLSYSSNNTFGQDLTKGNVEINENWVIENIPLALGYNELTVVAEYYDGSMSFDTVTLAYMYEDRMNGIEGLTLDTDKDGLEDYIEKIYGTDIEKYDTDDDGLSDYTELAVLGTNPLLYDTDTNGIADGDEDYDKDGLTNKDEEQLGTLLYAKDSDYDGLTDYEEVYVHNTNPVNVDTDNDGASDGFEVANGYNPLEKDDKFCVEKVIEVGNNIYELKLTADGENIESLEVVPVERSKAKYGAIAGYLDAALDFKINGDFEKAELKIVFDSSYLEIDDFVPALYYIDEEKHEMVEMHGDWDGKSNYMYVELPHFSTYILLNKTAFIRVWENSIKASAMANGGATNLNIVFVTDLSGSMDGSKLTTMKNAINSFIDVLSPADKAGIVSFTSYATTISELTSDKAILKNRVSSMTAYGLTSIYTGIERATDILTAENGGYRMIVVFTDGYDEPSTSYENYYKAVVEKAKSENICIYTIGIGTMDKDLLTKVANETGGLFYYAENVSELRKRVEDVQKEIIDYTVDSNGDGISDHFTKLLDEGKIMTWKHEPVIIKSLYEEIQNDADGDIDNDGIKNGDELKLVTDEDRVVQVIWNSDMENPDTDGDSLSDGLEKNLGTNLLFKDISEADYNAIVTNNGMYMSSLVAEDYVNGTWLKFQLAVGNAVFRFKVSYVEDYKMALIDFINAYNGTTIEQNALKKIADIYESDANEVLTNLASVITGLTSGTQMVDESTTQLIQELKETYVHLRHSAKQVSRMDSWMKFKDTNAQYITERMKYNKYFGEAQELSSTIKKQKLPDFIVDMSPKTKKVLGNTATGIGYGLEALSLADDIYNSCVAYGSLDAEYSQSDYLVDYLNYVKDNSNISELREAASQVLKAIEDDNERKKQLFWSIVSDSGDSIGRVAIDLIVSKLNPVAWAASFGLSLGDILAGTSALDEETLKIIALGNSADTYSKRINGFMVKDVSPYGYYLVDDIDLQRLQLLAQLRIVGEDEAARGYDASGIITKFIQRIMYGSQAEYENDLRDKIERLVKIGTKLGVSLTGAFSNSYLY